MKPLLVRSATITWTVSSVAERFLHPIGFETRGKRENHDKWKCLDSMQCRVTRYGIRTLVCALIGGHFDLLL